MKVSSTSQRVCEEIRDALDERLYEVMCNSDFERHRVQHPRDYAEGAASTDEIDQIWSIREAVERFFEKAASG